MTDADCVAFLQRVLPRLDLRWEGFRRVRRQVCRRLAARLRELGLADLAAYEAYLAAHPGEWPVLERLCRVTISRFGRDREVFAALAGAVLPELARAAVARGAGELRAWSAGCASGEEPYTLALLWQLELAPRYPGLELAVLATDLDDEVLERAMRRRYPASSLKELPEEWRRLAFVERNGAFELRPEPARCVTFARHDIREPPPPGAFDLVLCRNLAFTYFAPALQGRVARQLAGSLQAGGALVVGAHEALPEGVADFEPWPGVRCVYRRRGTGLTPA
jgi:chemotaxis protein methyltransferase CheR